MVDWLALESKIDRVVGKTFGESVYLAFLTKGTADPTRPAATISGHVLHVGTEEANSAEPGRAEKFRSRITAGEAELFIDRARYTGPLPRKGDKVRALSRRGQPWFEVALVNDRDTSLAVVTLNQA